MAGRRLRLTARAGGARRRWRGAGLLLAGLLGCRDPQPAIPAQGATLGQWVWSARDSSLLVASRREFPALRAGVWLATLSRRGDSLVTALGRPLDASVGADASVVIRLDDSFSTWWGTESPDTLAARLEPRIARLLQLAERGGAARPVQLDHDAPMARLAEYAALIARLRRPGGVLHDHPLWITSLVAHLADPGYGARFRPLVDGHIIQLFDTGERHTSARERELLARAERAAMPFQLGVGAFERRLTSGPTTHRAWFDLLPRAERSRWYRGAWIFPGGAAYRTYLHR